MSERVASDHDTVETHRASVTAVGRTERVQIELPEAMGIERDDVIWLALDGDGGWAQVTETFEGTPVVRRVVDNRRQAREDDGTDRLGPWIEGSSVSPGGSVNFDVLADGFAYGLRTPGKRIVYAPPAEPDSSLSDIASDLGRE